MRRVRSFGMVSGVGHGKKIVTVVRKVETLVDNCELIDYGKTCVDDHEAALMKERRGQGGFTGSCNPLLSSYTGLVSRSIHILSQRSEAC